MIRSILVLILMFAAAESYAMNGSANVECVGGDHVVTVGGWYFEEFDPEITGVVFRREAIGICEPDVILPETPLPFEVDLDPYGYGNYSATLTTTPPHPDVAYRYQPFGVMADGTLVNMTANCDADSRSYALANCNDAPIQRGRVELTINCMLDSPCIRIEPCDANCWSEFMWEELSLEAFVELSGGSIPDPFGKIVDVFGTRTYCTMPGGPYHTITRIELAPAAACGPVPVEETSWGSLKARYR